MNRAKVVVLPYISFAIFLAIVFAVWFVLVPRFISPYLIARPGEVLRSLPGFLTDAGLRRDLLSTVGASLKAFIVSIPLGMLLGVAVTRSGSFRKPSQFATDFLRSIPATALLPVFLIFFSGADERMKIAVGAFSSALSIGLAVYLGLDSKNETRSETATLMGLTGFRRFLMLDIPEAAPSIFVGLRAGISLALILVVIAEMQIGSQDGLGKVLILNRNSDNKGLEYAVLLMTGAIGYLYNWLLVRLEVKFIHWKSK